MAETDNMSPEMKRAWLYPLSDGQDTTDQNCIEAVLDRSLAAVAAEIDRCSPEL